MTYAIDIYAGPTAKKTLLEKGLQADLFDAIAGASGGPKWFTLFGLDKYLFGNFFANRQSPLYTIGSSAGSWRMACFAQADPVAAISRLAHFYSHETYSDKPDMHEISDKAEILLDKVLGETGAKEIVENPTIQSHFIVAKAKGLNASENKYIQLFGLAAAAGANLISRQTLPRFFERFIYFAKNQHYPKQYFDLNDLPTTYRPLTQSNVKHALMASGSIPLVLRGVTNIHDSPQGIYRDGGIIDYHLDLNFGVKGLVLYPHFFPKIKPGWFDKSLKSRNANLKNYEQVVLVTPSAKHVANLPFGKISDRTDFEKLPTEERINYWQVVLQESEKMAMDFHELVNRPLKAADIKDIRSIL